MTDSQQLSVLLPTSLTADTPDPKQKTLKIGQVGRALAIFRVDRVCVYDDGAPHIKNQNAERKLIATLLQYMETPQYLRKLLFPRSNLLRYAGLLPPLRAPHHPLEDEKTEPGSYREGGVIKKAQNHSIVEIGLKKKALVEKPLEIGTRCTVKLTGSSNEFFTGEVVSPEEVPEYWGYEVTQAKNLRRGLKAINADFTIATSRLGSDLYDAIENIKNSGARSLGVIFGGPYAGIFEICKRQGLNPKETFDAIVNTISEQGTATVRTEEALTATLSLLNVLLRR